MNKFSKRLSNCKNILKSFQVYWEEILLYIMVFFSIRALQFYVCETFVNRLKNVIGHSIF